MRRGEQGTGIAVFQVRQRSHSGCIGLLPSSPFLFLAFTPQELSQLLPGPLPQMGPCCFTDYRAGPTESGSSHFSPNSGC